MSFSLYATLQSAIPRRHTHAADLTLLTTFFSTTSGASFRLVFVATFSKLTDLVTAGASMGLSAAGASAPAAAALLRAASVAGLYSAFRACVLARDGDVSLP
jgi:hypothetical protein